MVCPIVPFRTYKSLIIFQMGYITVYLESVIAPQNIVQFIPTLPGTGQFSHAVPLQEITPHLAC